MLDDVQDALRRRDPQQAIAKARLAVQAEPENAEAHHLLGLALTAVGLAEEARNSIDRAIELAPERSDYLVSRAGLSLGEGDRSHAQQVLERAIALDPNQLAAYVLAAQLALTRSDRVEAERLLKLATLINPGHPHVLVGLGQVEVARGNHNEAMKLYSEAVAAAPDDALALSTLAHFHLARGHAAFAEQAYRRSLQNDPRSYPVRKGLFDALRLQNRMDEAATELDALRADFPDDPLLMQVAGEFELLAARPDEALQLFRSVLERTPENVRALAAAMSVWQREQQEQHGRDTLDALLATHASTDAIWEARFALEAGRAEGSRAVLNRWLAAIPDSAAALAISAQIHEAEGNLAEAERLADRAMARPAMNLPAELVKARVRLHEDPAAAAERLEYLAGIVTDLAHKRAVLGWLGYSSDRADRVGRALEVWQQSRALEEDSLSLPPAIGDIDAALERSAISAQASDDTVTAAPAVLLWGAPGSGVERIAATLRTQSELPLLDDRMRNTTRRDGFQTGDFSHLLNPEREADAAEAFAWYWRAGVREMGFDNVTVIDWLRRWDARLAPAVRRALPGSKLIVVMRDPRDMLLNWIAYGSPLNFKFPGPQGAANWLAMALEHVGWLSDHPLLSLCLLQTDDLTRDEHVIAEHLQRFLRLREAPSTEPSASLGRMFGGHSSQLPSGRWRAYREELAGPFATLTPIAERLGYPLD